MNYFVIIVSEKIPALYRICFNIVEGKLSPILDRMKILAQIQQNECEEKDPYFITIHVIIRLIIFSLLYFLHLPIFGQCLDLELLERVYLQQFLC